jgi:spermidine synthase
MIPWTLLDSVTMPGDGEELRLYRRGGEYSIRVGSYELMNSRVHGSEEKLAEAACGRIADRLQPRLLIGGLGMGYTLAAALEALPGGGRVTVAEVVPAVVAWNRGPLADLAGRPLEDRRVTVRTEDVALVLAAEPVGFDAILFDVDNGPEGLSRKENDRLYALAGLQAAFRALRPGGILGVWSAGPDRPFAGRLKRTGFEVEEIRVRARGPRGGASHVIWLARRPS